MELEVEAALHLEKLKYSLFMRRRFLPIFLATFLGALNDNLLRAGLIVLLAYSASRGIVLSTKPEILVTLCSALLVTPIMLFSSISGPLADKYEKSRLVKLAKLAELFIMGAACYGFATDNIYLLMAMLFVSGAHTCFYSPIKFSILPDHLNDGEILAANGFVAGGSYLAILLGMITGGLLVMLPGNVIGITAVGIAIVGFIASLFVLPSKIAHPETVISWNIWKGTVDIISYVWRDKTILLIVFALSWFLLIGSVYMSQFPNYAQSVVHANNEVFILFLTIFSIGVAMGSLACDTILRGQITPKLTPVMGLGISLFIVLMVVTTPVPHHEGLIGVHDFLKDSKNWPSLICMLLVAVCGGIYLVPLYALLQSRAHAQYRSRIMAASNLSDSVFMSICAIVSTLMLMLGFSILDLFLLVASLNLIVVWYAYKVTSKADI